VFAALLDFAARLPVIPKPDDEDYLVHITTGTHVVQICLFLLTESRATARASCCRPRRRRPAAAASPARLVRIIDLDLARYDRHRRARSQRPRPGLSFLKAGIATRNARLQRPDRSSSSRSRPLRDPILLTRPDRRRQDALARRIFELKQHAPPADRPSFVEVNCATLRGDAAMSALFGHVPRRVHRRGRRAPACCAADGGPAVPRRDRRARPDEQAMLLRALEEKRFLPLGADREVTATSS
jgi:transcriptional regulatory protein RtcR